MCNPCFFLSPHAVRHILVAYYMTTKLNILFAVGMGFLLVSHLKLAWNSVVQRRLRCFELAIVVKKVLRFEKGTQTKGNQMERLGRADLFVRMRVTER